MVITFLYNFYLVLLRYNISKVRNSFGCGGTSNLSYFDSHQTAPKMTGKFCKPIIFVHLKSLYFAFNTYFLTTQYPFSILYLLTQIQMNNVNQNVNSFKREFSRFLINNHLFCFEKAKNSLQATRISSFKYVFIVLSKKNRC